MYYQPPHQTPEDDLVDERWDTDLGFYPSESSLKEQPAETQYKSISYNDGKKQFSSPRSISSDSFEKINDLSTAFFREDVTCNEQCKDYFQRVSPIIVVDMASPLPTPSVSEEEEQYNKPFELCGVATANEEDFSIISLNELSLNECVTASKQQDAETDTSLKYKTPESIESYHLSLVQHYLDIMLRKIDLSNILQTLPDVYVTYIQEIKNSLD